MFQKHNKHRRLEQRRCDVCLPLGIYFAQVYPRRGLMPGTRLNERAAICPQAAPQPSSLSYFE
jgi:hypothetical protein